MSLEFWMTRNWIFMDLFEYKWRLKYWSTNSTLYYRSRVSAWMTRYEGNGSGWPYLTWSWYEGMFSYDAIIRGHPRSHLDLADVVHNRPSKIRTQDSVPFRTYEFIPACWGLCSSGSSCPLCRHPDHFVANFQFSWAVSPIVPSGGNHR